MEAEQEMVNNNSSETNSYSDFSVGESSASSSSYLNKKRVDSPFVRKTYDMVNNPEINSVVSWNSDGSRIVIWDAHKFAAQILPTYFRHNNLSSFVCQLNTYGFKKADWDKWEFQHKWFQRGKERWLKKIKRRTARSPRQLPRDEEVSAAKVEKEIKKMLDEQNAMEMEIKQLQEKQVILAKKVAVIRQAETTDVKGRKMFLLMAQDFLESKRGIERIEGENNRKGKIPDEEESPRLEKLVEEREDIMIGLENLI